MLVDTKDLKYLYEVIIEDIDRNIENGSDRDYVLAQIRAYKHVCFDLGWTNLLQKYDKYENGGIKWQNVKRY